MSLRRSWIVAPVFGALSLVTLTAVSASTTEHLAVAATHDVPSTMLSPSASTAPGTRAANRPSGRSVPGPGGTSALSAPRSLRPVRIEVPAIGVDATVTDLGIAADGVIEVPSDPGQAGWLQTTPAPGQQGPAVVAGHVDSETGPAVFYLLSSLKVGDRIDVDRQDGSTASFTVDGVRSYPQNRFPSAEVYGPVPGPALRLITCGGDYVKSHGGYQDNVVVYAS